MTRIWKSIAALGLALTFLLAPAAQAITPQQFKDLLIEYYYDEIPDAALKAETIDEIIEALGDPYTAYMDPEAYAAYQSTMSDGSIVGIGISGTIAEEGMLLTLIYADSPAEALGLAAGDIIIHVEGGPETQTGVEISELLRGEEGSSVTFRVRHADGTEETYTTQRAQIVIPATITRILDDGATGYIACSNFSAETPAYFVEGTEGKRDVKVWIVDMRDNIGGNVNAAAQSAGVFLGAGVVAYLRASGDEVLPYYSLQENTTLYPAINLINEMTASSAEIFTMAMKDSAAGMLIGSNTYGKGVAQAVLTSDLFPDILEEGEAVRITAFQCYGINGNTTQNIGVIPDLLVDPSHADEIALLFTSIEPSGDKTGWARLHLGGWRWYLDLSQGKDAEAAPYVAEMLSALPPGCDVFLGNGSGWEETTAEAIAEAAGVLKDYHPRRFTDTQGADCQHAADTLYTYGILQGMGDGTFQPDSGLTRAQLCAVLCQAMNLPAADNRKDFDDVSPNSWYAPYVKAAQAAGYVEGVGNNLFAPNDPVTHEQLITVLGRLAAELNLSFRMASKAVPADAAVPDGYSSWARPWAWLLALSQKSFNDKTLSMLYAPLEEIAPRAPATRGETAMILYTILNATSVIDY